MLNVDEARERILSNLKPLGTENVALEAASGRVLGEEITASEDLPSFDNSSVDGFAVNSSLLGQASPGQPVSLEVTLDIPAGSPLGLTLAPGNAARIMTGAPLPKGADSVVMLEDTDVADRQATTELPHLVRIFRPISTGQNIRRKGADLTVGQSLLSRGHRITPADIGLLAQLGLAIIKVVVRPRVAIISSGDELIPINEPSSPGKLRDTNSSMLAALANSAGADVIQLGIARDSQSEVEHLLELAVRKHADLIISSAGVSVGAFDFVRATIQSHGALEFWRVNMRPGKPLAFGRYADIPFMGLPGNPVSAYVGFIVFAAPTIYRLGGNAEPPRRLVRVRTTERIDSDGRESYLRAIVREDQQGLTAMLVGHQGSGNIFGLSQANALLIIPSGVKSVPPGEEVVAWLL